MPFQYKDFHKKSKDLFKKQYDFKNELKVTSKSNGVKIESGASAGFAGGSKANWTHSTLGEIEIEAKSCGLVKGKVCKKGVADGVDITLNGTACGQLGLETTYATDALAATAKATYNSSKGTSALMVCATVGMGDITCGGQVDLDGTGALSNYSAAVQYTTKDLVADIMAEKFETLYAHTYHRVSASTQIGTFAIVKGGGDYCLGLGTEHSIGAGLGVKAKADSTGGVAIALTHTLADPKMKVGVSAQYNALGDQTFKAEKFGISVNFGDF